MAGPLFFGPPGRQLFGFHHVPRGMPVSAVLVCPPWGHEYQYAHRTLNVLAGRLQARGAHVLRFDYSGTGDSWGDSTVASLDAWVEDLRHAVEELRMASGLQMVDLIGLRLGGYLAARATPTLHNIRTLLLWDAVTSGEVWLRDLGGPRSYGDGQHVELGNLLVTESFVEALRSVGPDDLRDTYAHETIYLTTQADHGYPDPPEVRGSRSEHLAQPAPWVEDASIWSGTVPPEAVKRIVECLT